MTGDKTVLIYLFCLRTFISFYYEFISERGRNEIVAFLAQRRVFEVTLCDYK